MAYIENRKIFCIFMVLMLGFSLFASGALARANCDKERCKHHNMKGLQNTKAEVDIVPMGCCVGTQSDPCDLEKSQTPEINDRTLSLARVEKGDPSDAIVFRSNHVPEDLSVMAFGPHPRTCATARSAPIYILNAALII